MRLYPALLVLLLLAGTPDAGPATATIKGKVIAVQNGKKMKNPPPIFVWAEDLAHHRADPDRKLPKAAIQQKGIRFSPNVLVVPVGTKIDFPNRDVEDHNVFSPKPFFDLGRYRPGQSKDHDFTVAGEVSVYCDVHQCMWARVLVVDVPGPEYIAQVDDSGDYTISGIPAGSYRIHAWTAGSKTVSSEDVTVAAGGSAAAKDLNLQVDPMAEQPAHKRKDDTDYPIYNCPRK